jgi:thiamine biosynthesis lipoprotein
MTWHRQVFETMGTVVSISIDAAAEPDRVISRLHSNFAHVDDVFSLYKPESELSQIASNRARLADASEELRNAYANAIEWRAATNGAFTPNRPDGVIDLSGIVKAIAMDGAGHELDSAGIKNWCLNVGGDVLVAGLDGSSKPWNIGITDPLDRHVLVTEAQLVRPRNACATSGSAERGDHIWTVGAAPTLFVQATVLANDIITADVLATAIIAGGPAALDRICEEWDIDAMTIDIEGDLRMTPGFARIPAAL